MFKMHEMRSNNESQHVEMNAGAAYHYAEAAGCKRLIWLRRDPASYYCKAVSGQMGTRHLATFERARDAFVSWPTDQRLMVRYEDITSAENFSMALRSIYNFLGAGLQDFEHKLAGFRSNFSEHQAMSISGYSGVQKNPNHLGEEECMKSAEADIQKRSREWAHRFESGGDKPRFLAHSFNYTV